MDGRVFKEGQVYDFADWMTKEIVRRTVTSVGIGHVWFKAEYLSQGCVEYENRPILMENGDEYVLLYIMDDNEARIWAYID